MFEVYMTWNLNFCTCLEQFSFPAILGKCLKNSVPPTILPCTRTWHFIPSGGALCKNSTLYRWFHCYRESGEFLQNQVCFQGHSSGILIEPHVLTHYARLLNGYSVRFLKLSGLLFLGTTMNCLPSSHTDRFQIRRNCSNSGIGGFIIFKVHLKNLI